MFIEQDFKLPKISIVTPSFNQGKFIESTIKSILDQGYPNLEFLIIDGGSTDGTVDIIKKYEKYITYWISEKDYGQAHAINKGLEKCTGDIIAWLNSDDLLEKGVLFDVANFFKGKLEQPMFLSGTCRYEEASGKLVWEPVVTDSSIKKSSLRTYDLLRCWKYNLVQPSTFWTRKAFEQLGYLDESRHFALDLDYWLRAVDQSIPIYHYNKVLSVFVYHDKSKSISQQNTLNSDLKSLSGTYLSGRMKVQYAIEYYIQRHSLLYLKMASSYVVKKRGFAFKLFLRSILNFPLAPFFRPKLFTYNLIHLLAGPSFYRQIKKVFD